MWGNLAGRLKENLDVGDLRETISRIGNAVAPPLDSDEEYETDEENEYEYYEEEEEEIVMEKEEQTPTLGYLLQHALDEEEETHHLLEVRQQSQDRHARPMLLPDEGDDDYALPPDDGTAVATREAGVAASSNEAAGAPLDWSSPEPHHVPGVAVPHVHKVISLDTVHCKGHFQTSDAKGQPEIMNAFCESNSILDVEDAQAPRKVISNGRVESHSISPLPPEPKVTEQKTKMESGWRTEKIEPRPTNVQDIQPPTFLSSSNESSAAAEESSSQKVEPNQKRSNLMHSPPMPASISSTNESRFPAQKSSRANNDLKLGHTNAVLSPSVPASVPSVKESRFAVKETSTANAGEKLTQTNAMQSPPMPASVLTAEEWRSAAAVSSTADVEAEPKPTIANQLPPMPSPASDAMEQKLAAKEPNLDKVEPQPKDAHAVQPPLVTVPSSSLSTPKEKGVSAGPVPSPPPADPSSVLSVQSEPKRKEKVSVSPIPPPPPVVNHNADAGLISAMEAGPKQTDSQTLLENGGEIQHLTIRCQELERHLIHAETHIVELQRDAAKRMDEEEEWRQLHLRQFQEEQARVVEASIEGAAEEHKRELAEMRDLLQQECLALKDQLQQERSESQRQSVQFSRLLEEQEARTKAAENEKRLVVSKLKSSSSQLQQQQERSIRMAEDKLAHTMAKLDEREDEVRQLKALLKELKASTTEHRKGVEEAEEEMDELHSENEILRQNLHKAEAERDELTKQLKLFESQKVKTSGLQMELKMLKEARDRERFHRESAAVNAESSQAELEAERDAALSTARDLERQLTAVLADLEIARSDTDRITMANLNLQSALEALQSEREAEMNLLNEQRLADEEAAAAAHAAAIEATHEANDARMREVQLAADAAIKNIMPEVQALQDMLEDSRKDNVNLRRSLDEAIHRLQTSQEDVIDRSFMKNILLDWFAKTGKGKKDVLALMASVLHFTEEEKDAIHIGDGPGAFEKVVGAVAAPLPPSATDMKHLEGANVREKWVNFLLAETGGDDSANMATESASTNGGTSIR